MLSLYLKSHLYLLNSNHFQNHRRVLSPSGGTNAPTVATAAPPEISTSSGSSFSFGSTNGRTGATVTRERIAAFSYAQREMIAAKCERVAAPYRAEQKMMITAFFRAEQEKITASSRAEKDGMVAAPSCTEKEMMAESVRAEREVMAAYRKMMAANFHDEEEMMAANFQEMMAESVRAERKVMVAYREMMAANFRDKEETIAANFRAEEEMIANITLANDPVV